MAEATTRTPWRLKVHNMEACNCSHGKGVLCIDASARPEQVQSLATILSGQAGGMPWEALGATLTEVEGPILQPIEMTINRRKSSFRVPGIIDVDMTSLINPVTGVESEVHGVYPKGGFIWNDGDVGTTATMCINHGEFHFQYPGKWAAYAVAEWTNQA
jgi:hypothetical protein